jgi:hypothetical protein
MPRLTPPTSPPTPKLEITSDRRWPRFNRARLAANLRILGWVVPLTILIWIWAEREQVLSPSSPNLINVPVVLTSDHQFVELSAGQPQSINLKISGPQEAIDRVRQAIFEQNVPHGVTLPIGDSPVNERVPIHVVDLLQNQPLFKQNGVTVEESQPAADRCRHERNADGSGRSIARVGGSLGRAAGLHAGERAGDRAKQRVQIPHR